MQRSIRVMGGSVVLAAPEKMTDTQFTGGLSHIYKRSDSFRSVGARGCDHLFAVRKADELSVQK
ncbi:MAG: hypothetical protein CME45_03690 [Halieaceae bacterium]|nr:hypothetical protein [Halieaceae bacterium]